MRLETSRDYQPIVREYNQQTRTIDLSMLQLTRHKWQKVENGSKKKITGYPRRTHLSSFIY